MIAIQHALNALRERTLLRLTGSIMAILALCATAYPLPAQDTASVKTVEVNSVSDRLYDIHSLFANVYIARIDATVAVFTNTKHTRFFMLPVLQADWSAFRRLVEALPDNDEKTHRIPMRIVLRDPQIQEEVFQVTQRDTDATIQPHHLNVVPHAFFQIEAMVGGRRQILVTSKNLAELEGGITAIAETNVPSQIQVMVEGSKAELLACAAAAGQAGTLIGKLYGRGYAVKPGTLAINVKALFESSGNRSLLRQETFKRRSRVATHGKTSGFHINLGIGSFNRNKNGQSIETTTNQQRVITGAWLSDLVSDHDYLIDVRETGDMGDAQDKMLSWLLARMDRVELEFVQLQNGFWMLGNEELGYARLNEGQVKSLMSAKPKADSSLENSISAPLPSGQTASNTRKSRHSFENEVRWERDADRGFIPTSVNMRLLDEAKLRLALSMTWERNVVAETTSAFVQYMVIPTSRDLEQTMPLGPHAARLALLDQRVHELGDYLANLTANTTVTTGLDTKGGVLPASTASNGNWTGWSQHTSALLRILTGVSFKPFKFSK